MKLLFINSYIMLSMLSVLITERSAAQGVPQGINYQGVARNSAGIVLSNQAISVKLGIYSPSVTGTLEWEEVHALSTNQFGIFYFIIGQGVSTGAGTRSSFSNVSWG